MRAQFRSRRASTRSKTPCACFTLLLGEDLSEHGRTPRPTARRSTTRVRPKRHCQDQPYYHFLLAGENTNVRRGMHFDCGGVSDNDLWATVGQSVGLPMTEFGGYTNLNYNPGDLIQGPITKALLTTLG